MSAVEEAAKVLADHMDRGTSGRLITEYGVSVYTLATEIVEALTAAGLLPEGETRTEWRVESESLEDEFGEDEARAREWLAITLANPEWEPAVLKRRVVNVTTGPWTEVQP